MTYALVTMSRPPNVDIMLPQSCGREKRYETVLRVHIFHSRTDDRKHKRGGPRVSVVACDVECVCACVRACVRVCGEVEVETKREAVVPNAQSALLLIVLCVLSEQWF